MRGKVGGVPATRGQAWAVTATSGSVADVGDSKAKEKQEVGDEGRTAT